MFERFGRDVRRYLTLDGSCQSFFAKVRLVVEAPQLQALAVYRFGHWVTTRVEARPARLLFGGLYQAFDKTTRLLWNMHIDPAADIGGGLCLGHAGFLLIGPVTMGEDCCVGPNTLIGLRTDGAQGMNVPKIGDRVWIGYGSVVFGGISVGSGATIGPLTVVGRNVAPRSLVLGSPMKVIRKEHDNTRQIYGKGGPLGSGTSA